MYVDNIEEIIKAVKKQFTEYENIQFDFYGNEICYTYYSGDVDVNIHEVQKWVCENFGLKQYQVELKTYVTVIAKNKEEACKIAKYENPEIKPTYAIKPFETEIYG